jgi:hypothetical protein
MTVKFMCVLFGSPFFLFLYDDLKIEMYELGCLGAVLYLGCRVEF